ncbi:MAG: hypothetical protein ACR2JJ_03740 [Sphingomicrobium sp.]
MRIALVVASIALVAACSDPPAGGDPSGPVGSGGPIGGNSADRDDGAISLDAGDLPRPGEGLRFVGNWADEGSCQSAAWHFTETTLQTPAGSNCGFNRVTQVPGGYDIQATCTAEAPPTSDTLKIRFAESANAMMFESETISDARLVFCGREV